MKKKITDWKIAPFKNYLQVVEDGTAYAMKIEEDELLDIDYLLRKFFLGCDIKIFDYTWHAKNQAKIKLKYDPPKSVLCWSSRGFELNY